jgi:putative sigma-54 modulation protein
MEVELTAKQGRISRTVRAMAEEGMERVGKILGQNARANITFGVERHLQIVEVTVQGRLKTIAAAGKADTQIAALREALAHVENQARRFRDRSMTRKRLPKDEKVLTAPPVALPKVRPPQPSESEEPRPSRKGARTKAAIAVHSFPAREAVVEPHVVKNGEAFALGPMTMEEAVKDAEFRDRELLIFRTPAGEMYVLHRRRDGQMELIEIP